MAGNLEFAAIYKWVLLTLSGFLSASLVVTIIEVESTRDKHSCVSQLFFAYHYFNPKIKLCLAITYPMLPYFSFLFHAILLSIYVSCKRHGMLMSRDMNKCVVGSALHKIDFDRIDSDKIDFERMFGYNNAELIKQIECCLDSFYQNCF